MISTRAGASGGRSILISTSPRESGLRWSVSRWCPPGPRARVTIAGAICSAGRASATGSGATGRASAAADGTATAGTPAGEGAVDAGAGLAVTGSGVSADDEAGGKDGPFRAAGRVWWPTRPSVRNCATVASTPGPCPGSSADGNAAGGIRSGAGDTNGLSLAPLPPARDADLSVTPRPFASTPVTARALSDEPRGVEITSGAVAGVGNDPCACREILRVSGSYPLPVATGIGSGMLAGSGISTAHRIAGTAAAG